MPQPTLGLFVPTWRRDYDAVPASVWIRALQMIPYFRDLGISVSLNNPFRTYDAAIVYRTPTRRFHALCRWLKKTSGRVYFDTVVNYFVPHARATPEYLHYQQKIAGLCDGLICSTEPLAEDARKLNARVHVMDDPLDVRGHFTRVKERIDYAQPQWGWSGVSGKIEPLLPYAGRLGSKPILLITDEGLRQHPPALPHRFRKWTHATFQDAILECDLALLPRTFSGDAYNSGHSAFKALVFAASGVPVVASGLPSYRKLATHFDGIAFLEDHGHDLSACVAALHGWQPAGRLERVREFYSCHRQARALLEFLNLEPTR